MMASQQGRPVWKQPRGRFGSNFWEVYSPKLDRNVCLYSNLERDHWVLVESDPNIVWFLENPIAIRIRIDGRDIRTVPDMMVRFSDDTEEYREVKHVKDLASLDERGINQLAAQHTWASVCGRSYRIIDDTEIRANRIYLANWKHALSYVAQFQPVELQNALRVLRQLFDSSPRWILGELENRCAPLSKTLTRAAIVRLLQSGHITADLMQYPFNSALILQKGQRV